MTRIANSLTQFGVCAILTATAVGCGAEKSENPLSPTVAGPIAGVSIDSPVPVSPTNRSEVVNTDPLRLVFNNASSNGVRPLWYVVEVGSDTNFSTKLYANAKVAAGDGGRTTVVVDGTLAAERTYYWRVKAADGANESTFSTAAEFDLVVPVIVQAPTLSRPAGGETTSTNTPTLTVTNGRVQGRTGTVDYRFFVSRDPSFNQIVAEILTQRSGSNTTSVQTAALPVNAQLFWRVIATNGVVTDLSGIQNFRTPAPAGGGGEVVAEAAVVVHYLRFRRVERRGVRILPPVSCCPCRTWRTS